MPACAANAMQCAKGFVLERALVMVALALDIAQDYLSVSGIPLLTPIIGVTEASSTWIMLCCIQENQFTYMCMYVCVAIHRPCAD